MMLALHHRQRLQAPQDPIRGPLSHQTRHFHHRHFHHFRHRRHKCLRMRTREAVNLDFLQLFFSSNVP